MNLNVTIQAPNGISLLTNKGYTNFVVCTIIDGNGNVFTSRALPAPINSPILTIFQRPTVQDCFLEVAFSNDGTRQNSVKWSIIGLITLPTYCSNYLIGIN